MRIYENIPLSTLTTFRIGGPARYFCRVRSEDDILAAVSFAKANKLKIFVLGEGSNILVSDLGFDGLVIKVKIKGITIIKTKYAKVKAGKKTESIVKGIGAEEVLIKSSAGEMWDELVELTVGKKLYGLENLSAIPGTVGAAPVQNIGAYGADVSQTIHSVRAYDLEKSAFVEIDNKDCCFGYRDSLFKKNPDRYIISAVTFKLAKKAQVNIAYSDLDRYFKKKGESEPSLSEVRDAVIEIRWNKLPNWKLWATAGSFFKNPVVSSSHYDKLLRQYPELPGFAEPDGTVKVSLGWILDKVCKMKGVCIGNVCTHESQALVIVAKPGATAEEVVKVTQKLMALVKEKTGIVVEGEVQWVN